MEGLFLFFFLLKGEREGWREIEWEKGIFRTSFSLLFSLLLVLPALNHLLVEKTNFSKNSSSFFVFLQSSSAIIPDFVRRSRGRKGEGGKKSKGETLRTRTRGPRRQLLERLVRDFQPLTSVAARSPTWSRQGPEPEARGSVWKEAGPSLILGRNCLQVEPSIPQ